MFNQFKSIGVSYFSGARKDENFIDENQFNHFVSQQLIILLKNGWFSYLNLHLLFF